MSKGYTIAEYIKLLKVQVANGELSYKQAEELAKPEIDKANAKIKEIAKKFGKKPKLISFKSIRGA